MLEVKRKKAEIKECNKSIFFWHRMQLQVFIVSILDCRGCVRLGWSSHENLIKPSYLSSLNLREISILENEISIKTKGLVTCTKLRLIPYIIVLATSLALAAGNIYMPSLPNMAVYFQRDSHALLMSVSLFYMGFALSGLIYGALADYIGRRPVILWGFFLFFIGACICLLSSQLWMFMLGSLLEGIGGAAPLIVGLATIQDIYTPQESVKTLGWMGALLAVMPSLSPILGGYLALIGWQANYLFLTIMSSLLLILIYKFFAETQSPTQNKSNVLKGFFSSYFTVIKHTGFLRYAALYPILVIGSTALLTSMPIYIMEKLGFSSEVCGYFVGFLTIGCALGGYAASRLVAKYGVNITLNVGILLSLISSIFLVISFMMLSEYMAFLIAAFLFQVGMAIVHPPSTTTAVRYFSDLRASASAVRGTFSILGSALGATIAAMFSQHSILYVACATLVVSVIAYSLSLIRSEQHV